MMKTKSFSSASKSENGQYVLRSLLQGQKGAVACITAHPLGTHVACGGELSLRSFMDMPLIASVKAKTELKFGIQRAESS